MSYIAVAKELDRNAEDNLSHVCRVIHRSMYSCAVEGSCRCDSERFSRRTLGSGLALRRTIDLPRKGQATA